MAFSRPRVLVGAVAFHPPRGIEGKPQHQRFRIGEIHREARALPLLSQYSE